MGEEGRQPDHALVVDGQTITLPSCSPAATPRRPWSRASTCWSWARGRPSRCWPRPGHLGWWQGWQTCVACGGYYWSWARAVGWDADVVVTCTASDVWVDEKSPDGRGLQFDHEDHKLLFNINSMVTTTTRVMTKIMTWGFSLPSSFSLCFIGRMIRISRNPSIRQTWTVMVYIGIVCWWLEWGWTGKDLVRCEERMNYNN